MLLSNLSRAQTVWGTLGGSNYTGQRTCADVRESPREIDLRLGEQRLVPFQSCDVMIARGRTANIQASKQARLNIHHFPCVCFHSSSRLYYKQFEGLPTIHSVPTSGDGRTFEAYLIPNQLGAADLNASATGVVALPIDYSGAGSYMVRLSSAYLGTFYLDVRLNGERMAAASSHSQPIAVAVICALGQEPMASGTCGCAAGSEPSGVGGIACTMCRPGFAKGQPGNYQCAPCAAGYHMPSSGASVCTPCPPATFQPLPEAIACQLCPIHTNSTAAATRCDVCAEGRHRESTDVPATEGSCAACPVGVSCPSNSTLATLFLDEGYWRLGPKAKAIYPCATIADNAQQWPSPCAGGSSAGELGSGYCRAGFYGPRCDICADPTASELRRAEGFFFDDTTLQCLLCAAESGRLGITIGVIVVLTIILSAMLTIANSLWRLPPQRIRATVLRMRRFVGPFTQLSLLPKLKQLITFFQLAISFPTVYDVPLPEQYTKLMRSLTGWLNVDDLLEFIYPTQYVARAAHPTFSLHPERRYKSASSRSSLASLSLLSRSSSLEAINHVIRVHAGVSEATWLGSSFAPLGRC